MNKAVSTKSSSQISGELGRRKKQRPCRSPWRPKYAARSRNTVRNYFVQSEICLGCQDMQIFNDQFSSLSHE